MDFKELNLNKGFSKPNLKERYKPNMEIKGIKEDNNKSCTNSNIRVEKEKPNSFSKNKIERMKVNMQSKNKIERTKVNIQSKNKIERPRIDMNFKNKLNRPKMNSEFKDQMKKFVNIPKDKIQNPHEIQKILINPKKRYNTKPIKFKLDKYVKQVVDKWLTNVNKKQRQLRLGLTNRFISEKARNFVSIYNKRGMYNYAGVVYRIIETGTGKMRYGSTTGTLDARWRWYKKDALSHINKLNITPFHKRILEALKLKKDLNKEYIMRPVEICFDVNTLAQREDYWIKRHNTQDPLRGYNIKGGGVGIRLEVPMFNVAKGIASGLSIEDIRISISSSTGMNFSRKTISRRIKQYWGGKVEARKKFLKPVLERIIKEGYKTNDIIHSFGNYGRNIVDRIIPQLFDDKSFSEVRRDYLKKRVSKYITMGLGPIAIDRELRHFGLTEINNALKEEWGSLDLAQRMLWKPIIMSRLRNGDHPEKILIDFGYTKNTAKSQYNRVLKRLFNGMTYTQIKEKIKNSSNYED